MHTDTYSPLLALANTKIPFGMYVFSKKENVSHILSREQICHKMIHLYFWLFKSFKIVFYNALWCKEDMIS